jgi:imidazole glycerol phosphate synthase glutamine amidotransferase subunit
VSSARPEVFVLRTGVANLASILAGLHRAGADPQLTDDAAVVHRARQVVLPGVGAFAAGMERLHAGGLGAALAERIAAGRSTLAVCLGLQLLSQSSEESPGVAGLGILPVATRRFPSTVRVPQLGWNRIEPDPGCQLLEAGYAYFANSYHLAADPPGFAVAHSDHGGRFVAAIERGPLLCCQFHPELSGDYGRALLRRWVQQGGG